MKLDPYLILRIKINLKWIKDLNVWPEAPKHLKDTIGTKLFDTGLGNDFWDMTPEVQATKAETNKQDYIKLKNSMQQRNHQQNEMATIKQEKYLQATIWSSG